MDSFTVLSLFKKLYKHFTKNAKLNIFRYKVQCPFCVKF